MTTCVCGSEVQRSARGRPRRWCSARCRLRAHRLRAEIQMLEERARMHDRLAGEARQGATAFGGARYLEECAVSFRELAAERASVLAG